MQELNLCFVYLAVNYLEIVVQLLSFLSFFPFFLASTVFHVPAKILGSWNFQLWWTSWMCPSTKMSPCVSTLLSLPGKVCVQVLVSSVQLLVVLNVCILRAIFTVHIVTTHSGGVGLHQGSSAPQEPSRNVWWELIEADWNCPALQISGCKSWDPAGAVHQHRGCTDPTLPSQEAQVLQHMDLDALVGLLWRVSSLLWSVWAQPSRQKGCQGTEWTHQRLWVCDCSGDLHEEEVEERISTQLSPWTMGLTPRIKRRIN